jgi:hypothetical protein
MICPRLRERITLAASGIEREGNVRRFFALAAVAAAALFAATTAGADDTFTFGDAAVLGPVHVRGNVADVHVRYSCTVGSHLWVSVKQSASRGIDPAVSSEGSGFGGAAAAWWQSHRGSFTCDGKRHVAWYTVDTVEPGSRGQLTNGWGWVQFCVTTEDDLSAIQMTWARVVTNG